MKCRHWIGDRRRYCLIPGARRYIQGFRCPLHTPAALAGRPEPGTAPAADPEQAPRAADANA
ncbi:hypothetical protein [Streptomyces sp. NPDC047070]|uniref:hypothetical protein n=1 Tax=Streptomyces sp. NPDC047070 TaxID=3154923 RepID=UPI0034555EEF